MDLPMESSKEYVWCTKLSSQQNSTQWEGRDDGGMEQLVLKRACLGVKAKQGERNLVEVVSFNHQQEKVQVCICSLRCGKQEDVGLSDLTIVPPAIFKLVEGSGPVHLVGNHMIMEAEEDDDDEDDSEADDLSDEEDVEEEVAKKPTAMIKKPGKVAKTNGKKQVDLDEDDEDEEDADDEDDELDSDEESEEEIPEPKPVAKKRKQPTEQEASKKPAAETPKKKKKEAETPKKKEAPKTPLQQKENKTPQSAKVTPSKTYETVDEVKLAIKKFPGGKPKKEDKFCNWVRHSFKVKDDEWVKELWKSHKREMGL